MGLLDWLFGSARPNERDTSKQTRAPLAIAPGRGFTVEVVGESEYQDELDRICGGKCEEGHRYECTANLLVEERNPHDPDAVAVIIDRKHVGYLPRSAAKQVKADIRRLNPNARPITCKAKIVGGWDRGGGDQGHYGVKLSISSPMRLI